MGKIIETGRDFSERTHFEDIVLTYDKIRPEYPPILFDDIFNYTENQNDKKAIEIGSGTGKATFPFLAAGYKVTAVEIGENMAKFLQEKYRDYKGFRVIVAAFEDALLEENNYDIIYAASSFHWVDAKVGCPKAWKLLRRGGTLALFRYNLVRADGEELYENIQTIYDKYYYSHYNTKKRPMKTSCEEFGQSNEILKRFGFKDLRDYGFSDISMKLYDVLLTFSADEYITFLDTLYDHRGLPKDNRKSLYSGIKETILMHGGCYKVVYIFQLYMGRK